MEPNEIIQGTYNFAQVLCAESDEICAQCTARGAEADLHFDGDAAHVIPDRFAVAFSGGGIRSSCIALGVTQALARAQMLGQVHYLSGISGGGYLLGWLTAWIARQKSLKEVEARLGTNTANGEPPRVAEPPGYERHVEPFPLHYLRRYSSYLAPRSGMLSGDTLAMVSVYLRNVLLNQTMLACIAIALMLLLQAPAFLNSVFSMGGIFLTPASFYFAAVLFAAAFLTGIWNTAQSLFRLSSDNEKEWYSASTTVIVCGLVACAALWLILPRWYVLAGGRVVMFAVGLVVVAGIAITLYFNRSNSHSSVERRRGVKGLMYVAAWAAAAFAGFVLHLAVHHWLVPDKSVVVSHSYAVLGLPLLLLAMSLISYLWVGVLGNSLPDAKREWLGRAAGYFLAYAVVIGLLFSIAFYGPLCMHLLFTSWSNPSWKKRVLSTVIPGGWLFTVVAGLVGGHSPRTDGETATGRGLNVLVAVAPPVFLLGLLLLVSWGTHAAVQTMVLPDSSDSPCAQQQYVPWADWPKQPAGPARLAWCHPGDQRAWRAWGSDQPEGTLWFKDLSPAAKYALLWAGFLCAGLLLAWRLDVNEFSLHLFYRNRLVRAFLGASRAEDQMPDGGDPRKPSPFTGFAYKDDVYLKQLTASEGFQGPYPIWGTCLNLTTGQDLAWQQRKGASFIYSPLFCGWDFVNRFSVPREPEQPLPDPDKDRADRTKDRLSGFGYRSTRPNGPDPDAEGFVPGYGGDGGAPLIGTAMAASGAAVSPNWGYHSQPAVAALLALFNLRLGWWAGNPRHPDSWDQYAPPIGYLAAELIGQATASGRYVYLSDGGHFENLGIYELVRRRVRFIICSDADADPTFDFGDLGNAIDHCRRDFGVEIKIGAQRSIAASKDEGFRDAHYAIGEIFYPGQTETGLLLYVKSSLTSDEPSDVLGMKAQDKNFPHDTTLNQFFNEGMFESYRARGQHMLEWLIDKSLAEPVVAAKTVSHTTPGGDRVRALYEWLKAQRGNPSEAMGVRPIR